MWLWIQRVAAGVVIYYGPFSRTSDQHMATTMLCTENERKLNICLSQELKKFSYKKEDRKSLSLCGPYSSVEG